MSKRIHAADLFCGAGGFTSGLLEAASALGFEVDLLAVNHWNIAIETHAANHPGVRHLCKSIDTVRPRDVIPGGKLNLLMASPECIHHSNARGGKPMSDQSRATAWLILEWLEALDVENVLIENVPEFRTWGPLYPDDHRDEKLRGRPIEKQKGRYFRNFIRNLKCLGYRVDYQVLCAANYGDATTRKRLFIVGRKGRSRITWPAPTHLKAGAEGQADLGLYEPVQPWRPAREIIDWSIRGESIYGRKKPLAENTMRRIITGLRKFSGIPFLIPNQSERPGQEPRTHSVDEPMPTVTATGWAGLVEPFLIVLRQNCDGQSVDGPLPTITAGGQHIGLAEPFLLPHQHGSDGPENVRSLEMPLPTVTGTSSDMFLAAPYVVNMKGQSNATSVEEPAPTITAGAPHLYAAEPFVMGITHSAGGSERVYDQARPLPTLTTQAELGIVEPAFVLGQQSGAVLRPVSEPVPTIAGAGAISLVETEARVGEPYTVGAGGPTGSGRPSGVDQPLKTVLAESRLGLADPYMVAVAHTADQSGRVYSVDEPTPTLTTRNCYAVAEPEGFITSFHNGRDGDQRVKSLDDPLPTLDTSNRHGLAQPAPFLIPYHSSADGGHSVDDPLRTIDTRDRFALITPEMVGQPGVGPVVGWLDIRFRMLQPHELAAAMSFPSSYEFAGNREAQVKQIGNAVPVKTAAALTRALIADA